MVQSLDLPVAGSDDDFGQGLLCLQIRLTDSCVDAASFSYGSRKRDLQTTCSCKVDGKLNPVSTRSGGQCHINLTYSCAVKDSVTDFILNLSSHLQPTFVPVTKLSCKVSHLVKQNTEQIKDAKTYR
jgi:hypothetical protein